jgi:hypothetical protein
MLIACTGYDELVVELTTKDPEQLVLLRSEVFREPFTNRQLHA